MEQLVKNVEQRLEAFIIKSDAARKAYQDRVIAKGESLNNGLKPTLGSGGRLHAPTDFYTYEWEVDESLMEKEFMAGEFLPWDRVFNPDQLTFTYEPSKSGRRIDYVEVEMAEALIKAFSHLGPVGVSSGKEFESKGKYVCHVYVDTRCKEAFEMIEDFVHGPRREAARIEREKERSTRQQSQYQLEGLKSLERCWEPKHRIPSLELFTKCWFEMTGDSRFGDQSQALLITLTQREGK